MATGEDIKALPDIIPDIKFNLESQEQFGKDKGVVFEHFAAIPSTVGKIDRGDLRRPEALDTIAENGYIYTKVGEFVGTIIGNSKKHNHSEGGIMDTSEARLVLPKFYNEDCGGGKEIALLPGDRIYPKKIEVRVPNYQEVEYRPKASDTLQFPAKCVQILRDSNNVQYNEGVDFIVNSDGDIQWIDGKRNPGIDPSTGKGRLYGVRYMYVAFWYVQRLINEVRITNTSDANAPARLPYHAIIQREYVYHNKPRGDKKETNVKTETPRTQDEPVENIEPNDYQIRVDVRDFED
ncbi:MAG TPA: hypothetical protein DDY18_07815 [Flavobacterium sp.]|jgi:hypothetical protein|nr:hypothetical protein [Flavobacterium sp.]